MTKFIVSLSHFAWSKAASIRHLARESGGRIAARRNRIFSPSPLSPALPREEEKEEEKPEKWEGGTVERRRRKRGIDNRKSRAMMDGRGRRRKGEA